MYRSSLFSDFPGGPVVKTPCFQCRGHMFNLWSGKIPHAAWCSQKKKKKSSLFSTSSPTFVIWTLFDDNHYDRCEVISHCGFDLHFSNN